MRRMVVPSGREAASSRRSRVHRRHLLARTPSVVVWRNIVDKTAWRQEEAHSAVNTYPGRPFFMMAG